MSNQTKSKPTSPSPSPSQTSRQVPRDFPCLLGSLKLEMNCLSCKIHELTLTLSSYKSQLQEMQEAYTHLDLIQFEQAEKIKKISSRAPGSYPTKPAGSPKALAAKLKHLQSTDPDLLEEILNALK